MMRSSISDEVADLRSKKINPCMICPICNLLLRDATTINECLHTFCRKCIHKKITKEELNHCPVCNVNLGGTPLEKLRPDHLMQGLRAKFYANINTEAKEPEAVPAVPLPARRKERSLSSLVSTPSIPSQTAVTRRRRRPAARKSSASRESGCTIEELRKKVEALPESSSSPVNISKSSKNQKQNCAAAETSEQDMPNKGLERRDEPLEAMNDLWTPLNCLVEAAGIKKVNKANSQGMSVAQPTPSSMTNGEEHAPKANVAESGNKEVHDDENGLAAVSSISVKPRKARGGRRKKAVVSEGQNVTGQDVVNAESSQCQKVTGEQNVTSQGVVNAASSQCQKRITPIWFTLVASDNQEGIAPLPQLPPKYVMIRNVNLPVSYIKQYAAQKLNLQSESEVELTLQGQPLLPTLQMHNIIDMWLQIAPSELVKATVGSSAKDFVMVIGYGRKATQRS